jgi:hypothetical protein
MTTIELTRQEWQALVDDHSAALELLRDLVRDEPQHYDGCACIVCRARTFLFTEPGKRRPRA